MKLSICIWSYKSFTEYTNPCTHLNTITHLSKWKIHLFKNLKSDIKHQNQHTQRSKVPLLILSIKSVLLLPLQIVKHVTDWHSPNSRHIHSVHVHTERALVWLKISANQNQLKHSWLQGEHVNDCKHKVLRRMAFIYTSNVIFLTFCT